MAVESVQEPGDGGVLSDFAERGGDRFHHPGGLIPSSGPDPGVCVGPEAAENLYDFGSNCLVLLMVGEG